MKIAIAFLNIDYLYKVLCTDNNFYYHNALSVKYFPSVKDAVKFAKNIDIKNLHIVQLDDFSGIKVLKRL